jgi:hypothetical protein
MNEELARLTQEDWASRIGHAENLLEDDFAKEMG